MNRSTKAFLLLLLIIVISLADSILKGSKLAVQALPLCGLAILYGCPAVILGLIYIAILDMAMGSLSPPHTHPIWQVGFILLAPCVTLWINILRERGIDYQRMQRRLLEGMRDGVILCDPEGVIHLVNPAACTLLNLPSERQECFVQLQRLGIVNQWNACIYATQRTVTAEYTIEERQIQVTVTPVIESSHVMGLVTSIVDFTAERQLTSMREDFLALISHELRNPLTSVNGFMEVLLADGLPDHQAQYARVIKRNTDRMLRLVRDLLQVRALEVGSFQLQPQLTNLTEVIQQLVDGMRLVGQEADIAMAISAPEFPVWGSYDPDRITQVFANLLDNAVKFSSPGSRVRVTISVEADHVLVEVNDNGPGIPADEIDKIFNKYYQISSGRSVAKGLGLGLAVCRHLVELHDGKIWVTSSEKDGTSFWVGLSRCTEADVKLPWQQQDTASSMQR